MGAPIYPGVHCRLLPLWHDHNSISLPSAVEPPVASRQRPDCAPVMVPLETVEELDRGGEQPAAW